MTERPADVFHPPSQDDVEEPHQREHAAVDPDNEPNAPNREPVEETVGPDGD